MSADLPKDYRAYYAQRPAREAREERDLLDEWQMSDDEAWSILESEETRNRYLTR
jgi:hypothetical protein